MTLVLDSWQRSFSRSKHAGVVPNNLWRETMRKLVTGLLARGARVLVACSPDDSNQILGWCCYEGEGDKRCLHYVYVKEPWRQDGIGEQLVTAALGLPGRCFVTHQNDGAADLFRFALTAHGWRFAHEPAIARRKDF